MFASVQTLANAAGLRGPAPQKEVALMKRIVLLVAMLAMMAFLAAPALAQGPPENRPPENPGVETGTDVANSFCAFSGLNDFEEGVFPFLTKTQNYGQLVQQGLKGEFPSPGDACNPTKPPPPEE
jgi:hypothetical protein